MPLGTQIRVSQFKLISVDFTYIDFIGRNYHMKAWNTIMIPIVLAVLFMFAPATFATSSAELIYFETMISADLWQYDYTFNNTSDAGESLFKIFLDFTPDERSTEGFGLPAGWIGIPWEGTKSTTFLATQSLNSGFDIAAGSSQNGFSFTIDNQVGNISFSAQFDAGGGNLPIISGTTAVAPEPISSVLFLIGGTTLAARSWYRRKRKAG
jgi:hypothetical protein